MLAVIYHQHINDSSHFYCDPYIQSIQCARPMLTQCSASVTVCAPTLSQRNVNVLLRLGKWFGMWALHQSRRFYHTRE